MDMAELHSPLCGRFACKPSRGCLAVPNWCLVCTGCLPRPLRQKAERDLEAWEDDVAVARRWVP